MPPPHHQGGLGLVFRAVSLNDKFRELPVQCLFTRVCECNNLLSLLIDPRPPSLGLTILEDCVGLIKTFVWRRLGLLGHNGYSGLGVVYACGAACIDWVGVPSCQMRERCCGFSQQ